MSSVTGQSPGRASNLRPISERCKWHVMKHAQDSLGLQVRDERITIFGRRRDDIKHVIRLLAIGGNKRQGYVVFLRP